MMALVRGSGSGSCHDKLLVPVAGRGPSPARELPVDAGRAQARVTGVTQAGPGRGESMRSGPLQPEGTVNGSDFHFEHCHSDWQRRPRPGHASNLIH